MGMEVVISIQKKDKMAPSNWDVFNDMPCVWWSGGSGEMAKAICRNVDYCKVDFTRLDCNLINVIKEDLRGEKSEHLKAVDLCNWMAKYSDDNDDRLEWVKNMMEHKDTIAEINRNLEELDYFLGLIDNGNELYVGVSY